jgi:hypothetical protein
MDANFSLSLIGEMTLRNLTQESNQQALIDKIPSDMLLEIFRFLTIKDLSYSACLVSL